MLCFLKQNQKPLQEIGNVKSEVLADDDVADDGVGVVSIYWRLAVLSPSPQSSIDITHPTAEGSDSLHMVFICLCVLER